MATAPLRRTVEQPLTAAIQPKRAGINRDEPVERLVRDLLDILKVRCFASQVTVAQVRALVIDPHATREPAESERERDPDDVVGVEQVVGTRDVKLREDSGNQ